MISRTLTSSLLSGLLLAVLVPGANADILGTAGSFAVLGGSTVTNTGSTTLSGNLGLSPGTAVTGFPPGLITGGILHAADGVALQGQIDNTSAYNVLAGLPFTSDLTGSAFATSVEAGLTGAGWSAFLPKISGEE